MECSQCFTELTKYDEFCPDCNGRNDDLVQYQELVEQLSVCQGLLTNGHLDLKFMRSV